MIDHGDRRSDEGFSLMELIVAMMIITAVLFTLVAVQVSTLATTIHAKQRQQGTAVANEVMEELRALPWATLQKGLHPDFAVASGGDPNVISGRLRPPADPSIDEVIVTASNQVLTAPPLSGAAGTNRTVRQDPAVPGIDFVARTYVTTPDDLATGVIQLTVIVSWTEQGSGDERSTIVRSAAYSPRSGGCGDTTTQPFLGACQAMLDSEAGARGFVFSVSGVDTSVDPAVPSSVVPGGSVLEGGFSSANVFATMDSNQAATAAAGVTSAGSSEATATTTAEAGWLQARNAASTDVGAAGAPPANPADVAALGSFSGSRNFVGSPASTSLTLSPPGSLTGLARAKAGGLCLTGIPAGQPCSQGTTSVEGSSSARLTLPGGSFDLFTSTGASQRNSWTGRFATLPSTSATVGCTSITGAGCVSSGASRTFEALNFGVGAWQKPDGTAGPASRLVQISNFNDSVRVEHGVSKGSVTPVTSRSGTLSYWNGATMANVSLTASTNISVDLAPVKRSLGSTEILATGKIIVQPASVSRTGSDAACAAEACGVTAEMPSVFITVTYTIVDASGDHDVVTGFDLGSVRAAAKYKAAPDA